MRFAIGPALLLLNACSEGDGSAPGDDTETPIGPEPTTEDTGWPPGELANIHIAHSVTDNRTRVYGLFSESAPSSFVNLAQCMIEGSVCLSSFPDEGEWEEVNPDEDGGGHENVSTKFVGFELGVGEYTLPYIEEPETGFGFYNADVSNQPLPLGWIGVSWGGSWKVYEGTEDLYVPPPVELIAPALGAHTRFTNGQEVVVEWVPTGEGEVTLTMSGESDLYRLFTVEDDGYHAFNVDLDLGFTNDTEEVTFTLARWSQNELRKYGHVVDLVSSSAANFTSTYTNVGTRTRLHPADQCTEAQGLATLATGGYWGYLDPFVNDLDPTCVFETFTSDARGNEGLVRLDLQPYESVAVDYNVYDLSASVYFLEDCTDVNSCVTGTDLDDQINGHEFIEYFNNSDDIHTLYLGLDSTLAGDSIFTLDLTVTPLIDPDLYDTCAEAKAPDATVVSSSNNYFEPFVSYTGDLNPGVGGCTMTSLGGNEAIMPIDIPPSEVLTVNVQMEAPGDPGLYVLYDCTNPFLCGAGRDGSFGTDEQLSYTNNSADVERVFLVIDSKSGLHPFSLGLTIGPP